MEQFQLMEDDARRRFPQTLRLTRGPGLQSLGPPLCLALLSTLAIASRLAACPETVFGEETSSCILRNVTYREDLKAKEFRLRLELVVADCPEKITVTQGDKEIEIGVKQGAPVTLAKSMHHLTFFYGGPSKFFWGCVRDAAGKKAAILPMGAGVSFKLHQGEKFDEAAPFVLEIEMALVHRFPGVDVELLEWVKQAKAKGTDIWLDSPMEWSFFTGYGMMEKPYFRIKDDPTADLIEGYKLAKSNSALSALLGKQVVVRLWGDRFYSHPAVEEGCRPVFRFCKVKRCYVPQPPADGARGSADGPRTLETVVPKE